MSLLRDIRRAATLSPAEIVRRVARRARKARDVRDARRRAVGRPTYAQDAPAGDLLRLVVLPRGWSLPERLDEVARHYLAHRFDLLGSGWTEVRHGAEAPGVEGHRFAPGSQVVADPDGRWLEGRVNERNLPTARAAWRLVSPGYVPIDWQVDFKSGFRWSEETWQGDIAYGDAPGADVKVPWELSRLQHLPQLALVAASAQTAAELADRCAAEVRDEVLDFVAANPPAFGANWSCTMEVGIRVANMVLAVDILRAAGRGMDPEFAEVFGRSVFEHARHIAANLEWMPDLRSNHYLGDVVGLLYAAAALPRTPLSDAWLALAVQETAGALDEQFGGDGGDCEGSTCYHRLCAEMAAWGLALASGLPEEKRAALLDYDHTLVDGPVALSPAPLTAGLAPRHFERIERAAELVLDTVTPDGTAPQFGDNDSGRFFKLSPVYRVGTADEMRSRLANLERWRGLPDDASYLDESHLDHGHVPAVVSGIVERDDLAAPEGAHALDAALAASLAGGRAASYRTRSGTGAETVRVGGPEELDRAAAVADGVTGACHTDLRFEGADLLDGLETRGYPDFGLYVFHSPRLYLAVRCGAIGQGGAGGHDHNDQLAVEVWVDGVRRVADPGTYLYTPLPERRNAYRSVGAHHAPRIAGREPGRLDLGLFQIVSAAAGRAVFFGPAGFCGHHDGYGVRVHRLIRLMPDGIRISDWAEGGSAEMSAPQDGRLPYSPGYGVVERGDAR